MRADKTFSPLASWLLALALLPTAAWAADACPPRQGDNAPPKYPDPAFQPNAEVTLLIGVDRCGAATTVEALWTSGYPALDAAAVEAARGWRFDQGRGGRVRVPVAFVGNGPSAPTTLRKPTPEFLAILADFCAMRVPPVAANADGTLPGFIADPAPFGFDSIAAAEQTMAREGVREVTDLDKAEGRGYITGNTFRWERWRVFKGNWEFAPSVMKQRKVFDGEKSFIVTGGRCEAADPAKCARFESFLRDFNKKPQPAQEGPPPLPAGSRCL
ncbi:TonB family protein [Lysobacter enzymogenes]|uniref:TonB family protein n=1 Tax=Lysobacter enzymogenes TaxID=69 RepID=UPI001A95B8F6|nr:TonB family protein [Lysobacter enzymogenes]QQP96071.1 TonB family protein [Lysobacter enzymogenes]